MFHLGPPAFRQSDLIRESFTLEMELLSLLRQPPDRTDKRQHRLDRHRRQKTEPNDETRARPPFVREGSEKALHRT